MLIINPYKPVFLNNDPKQISFFKNLKSFVKNA